MFLLKFNFVLLLFPFFFTLALYHSLFFSLSIDSIILFQHILKQFPDIFQHHTLWWRREKKTKKRKIDDFSALRHCVYSVVVCLFIVDFFLSRSFFLLCKWKPINFSILFPLSPILYFKKNNEKCKENQ